MPDLPDDGDLSGVVAAALGRLSRRLRRRLRDVGSLDDLGPAEIREMWRVEVGPIVDAVTEAFALSADDVAASFGISGFTPRFAAERTLAEATNRLVNVADDVWEIARAQLVEGVAAAESIPQLSARLSRLPRLAGPRAETVARTEVVSAANLASLATAQASGVVQTKTWLATNDDRTREAHADADGQTVPVDQAFTVGGESLQYPGDPSGSPENVINCRCTQTYGVAPAGEAMAAADEEDAMPWHIVKGGGTCADAEWAVIKDDDGSTAGCHETQEDAQAQLAALNAAESEGLLPLVAGPTWSGVITIEGRPTMEAPAREFAAGSLTWERLPVVLQWEKEGTHGGEHSVTVPVGTVDEIERRDGGIIWGSGRLSTASEDALTVTELMREGVVRWVSIVPDSITDADVELVMPEDADDETVEEGDDGDFVMLFGPEPEKVVFHAGRIRAVTLVDIAAFIEAEVALDEQPAAVERDDAAGSAPMPLPVASTSNGAAAGAIGPHDSGTSEAAWDSSANEARVRSPETLDYFRGIYAWGPDPDVDAEDGRYPKSAFRFIHHEVGDGGRAGAANVTACSNAIGVLHGGRAGTTIPVADRRGVYNHLAKHLRDAGREVPEFDVDATVVAAGTHTLTLHDRPPAWWFDEPTDVTAHGALTITDEGRLYGYLAPTNVGHISPIFRGRTVPLGADYRRFLRGETICEGGDRVVTGNVTMGCNHAPRSYAGPEVEQFENSCSIFGTARIGENGHGVWIAGAVLPSVTADMVDRAMACQLSGHWRPKDGVGGGVECFSALLVPVPGFAEGRRRPSVRYRDGALVASAVPVRFERTPHRTTVNLAGLAAHAARLQGERDERAAELAAAMAGRCDCG
jgi:hypothetical protein